MIQFDKLAKVSQFCKQLVDIRSVIVWKLNHVKLLANYSYKLAQHTKCVGVIVGVLCDSHNFYTHITDLHTFSYLVPFRAFQLVIFVGLSLYLFEVRHNPAKD